MGRRIAKMLAGIKPIIQCIQKEKAQTLQSDSPIVGRINANILATIDSLKQTAAKKSMISLSCNQITQNHYRFFVMHRQCNRLSTWRVENSQPQEYLEIINPKIIKIGELVSGIEECPSFPYLLCMVDRPENIQVSYTTANNQKKEKQLSGFQSRVFQHEMDHCLGRSLLYSQVHQGNLMLDQKVIEQFPRTSQLISDINRQFTRLFKEYPQLKLSKEQRFMNQLIPPKTISIENDLIKRFLKHYRKELLMFRARQAL